MGRSCERDKKIQEGSIFRDVGSSNILEDGANDCYGGQILTIQQV